MSEKKKGGITYIDVIPVEELLNEAESSVRLDKSEISTRSEKKFETASEFLVRKGNVTLDYYTQKIHCFYSLNDESEDVNINNIDKKNLDSLDKQFINKDYLINRLKKLTNKGEITPRAALLVLGDFKDVKIDEKEV